MLAFNRNTNAPQTIADIEHADLPAVTDAPHNPTGETPFGLGNHGANGHDDANNAKKGDKTTYEATQGGVYVLIEHADLPVVTDAPHNPVGETPFGLGNHGADGHDDANNAKKGNVYVAIDPATDLPDVTDAQENGPSAQDIECRWLRIQVADAKLHRMRLEFQYWLRNGKEPKQAKSDEAIIPEVLRVEKNAKKKARKKIRAKAKVVAGAIAMDEEAEAAGTAMGVPVGVLRAEEEKGTEPRREPRPEPPDAFVCPITYDTMRDPVIATDGYSYERHAIVSWFELGNRTSPMTGAAVVEVGLIPNHGLRSQILEWRDAHHVAQQ